MKNGNVLGYFSPCLYHTHSICQGMHMSESESASSAILSGNRNVTAQNPGREAQILCCSNGTQIQSGDRNGHYADLSGHWHRRSATDVTLAMLLHSFRFQFDPSTYQLAIERNRLISYYSCLQKAEIRKTSALETRVSGRIISKETGWQVKVCYASCEITWTRYAQRAIVSFPVTPDRRTSLPHNE